MSKIRILLADDHAMLRSGLRVLINMQQDMEIVGEAGDFIQAFAQTQKLLPDLVVLDLGMPGGTGVKTIEQLMQLKPAPRVLVLSMHDDPAYVRSAMAVGATGYVVKSAADSELISAIRAVSKGRVFIDVPTIERDGSAASPQKDSTQSALQSLSDREREVFELIAQGHTNQAVADKLFLSVKTVESYRARLMEKLHLQSRADLMRLAIETGILKQGPVAPPPQ